ncbi:glycosyltransferase family 9 protein [bacterium]|nr:glycosyltransferase family 9 protein [bacterium]
MKYLIIRLGAIGDVVHSTIIAQAIKNKDKNCEIHFLTADFIKPLIEMSPFVDKVIPFDMKKSNNIFYLLKMAFKFLFERYDIIFPLSNTTRNVLMTYLAFPKKVVKRNKNRVHAVDAFFNTAVDGIGELDKPKKILLNITDELKTRINDLTKEYKRPYFVFSPGGANDNARQGRIWSDEYWLELGNMLTEKYGGTVFVCGSKEEEEHHRAFEKINNSKVFSGKLTLEESAALYSMSDVFFSGDSGPLHIAACFDCKIIALYGSTNPISVSPFGHDNSCITPKTECKFCGQKLCKELMEGEKITPCMLSITPEMVMGFIEAGDIIKAGGNEQ